MQDYRKRILEELTYSLEGIDCREIEVLAKEIREAGRIFCDGLGRSRLAMQGFAMRLAQMELDSVMVGEVTAPAFREGDLLVICSASGASETLKYHARKAREYGGRVMLVTGKAESALAEYAIGRVMIPAPDKDAEEASRGSIQPMGALFEQSAQLVCDMTVLELMDQMGLTSGEMRKHHANIE